MTALATLLADLLIRAVTGLVSTSTIDGDFACAIAPAVSPPPFPVPTTVCWITRSTGPNLA